MFALAGASRKHVRIVTNIVAELSVRLEGGPCEVYSSDLRVKVSESGPYTYPDVLVVCGEPEMEDDDILLNPRLIVEVLSPSTEAYDRGGSSSTTDAFLRWPSTCWLRRMPTGLSSTRGRIGSAGC